MWAISERISLLLANADVRDSADTSPRSLEARNLIDDTEHRIIISATKILLLTWATFPKTKSSGAWWSGGREQQKMKRKMEKKRKDGQDIKESTSDAQ